MSVRVGLFATTLLGFMYGVLSLTNSTKTDVGAGMLVALAGIIGWLICNYIEGKR